MRTAHWSLLAVERPCAGAHEQFGPNKPQFPRRQWQRCKPSAAQLLVAPVHVGRVGLVLAFDRTRLYCLVTLADTGRSRLAPMHHVCFCAQSLFAHGARGQQEQTEMEVVQHVGHLLGHLLGRTPDEAWAWLQGYAELLLLLICIWLIGWALLKVIETMTAMGRGLLVMVCYVILMLVCSDLVLSLSKRSPHLPPTVRGTDLVSPLQTARNWTLSWFQVLW